MVHHLSHFAVDRLGHLSPETTDRVDYALR
jgi:hypothetical protein